MSGDTLSNSCLSAFNNSSDLPKMLLYEDMIEHPVSSTFTLFWMRFIGTFQLEFGRTVLFLLWSSSSVFLTIPYSSYGFGTYTTDVLVFKTVLRVI